MAPNKLRVDERARRTAYQWFDRWKHRLQELARDDYLEMREDLRRKLQTELSKQKANDTVNRYRERKKADEA